MPERKKKRWYNITIKEALQKVGDVEVLTAYSTALFAYIAVLVVKNHLDSKNDTEEPEDE